MRSLLTIVTFLLLSCLTSNGQTANAQSIKSLVDSGEFVFQVRDFNWQGSHTTYLSTHNYSMTFTKDEIAYILPNFSQVPIPTQTYATVLGQEFASEKFTYMLTSDKKNGWIVDIFPKDDLNTLELVLTITTRGEATLKVFSNTRTSMSFEGWIAAL